jgi:hypothetical protein
MYEVSDLGRVRRNNRLLTATWSGRAGKQYLAVCMTDTPRRRCGKVHQLVAEAFLGPRPEGIHTAHLNGDRADNRLANIAYVTPSQNNLHKREHGTMVCGSRQHNSTLTKDQVEFIRAFAVPRDPRFGFAALARRFSVSEQHVGKIVSGKAWRHAL